MSTTTIEVTADNFDAEVLNSQTPVLVDYWAPWCGPCKALAPILEDLAGQYADKLKVAKINIDDDANKEIAVKYGIRSIPTLMLFKGGENVETIVGAVQKAKLETVLAEHDINA